MKTLLVIHVILLLLTFSNLSLITFWVDGSWSFSFAQISHKDSFGKLYEFDYSFFQVITYIACYATGLFFYLKDQKVKPSFFSKAAIFICLVGLASFVFELSHWLVNFNYSLILSFPIILIFTAIFIGPNHCKNIQVPNN